MRNCADCGKEDAPWFEREPCSCGTATKHEDDPSPLKHAPDCNGIGHEVVEYPLRMARADLVFEGTTLALSNYWRGRGWILIQNGLRWYRVKMLCRGCIVLEDSAQERRREYEKACKAARGQDDTTYSQMLAQQ